MKTETFIVKKMHCECCAKSIEIDVSEISGVKEVNASFKDSSVKVTYDGDDNTLSLIIKILSEEHGFLHVQDAKTQKLKKK